MTCTGACRCRCQQIGCGCHEVMVRTAATFPEPPKSSAPMARCGLCQSMAHAQHVRSDAGRVITVILCGHCDVRQAA